MEERAVQDLLGRQWIATQMRALVTAERIYIVHDPLKCIFKLVVSTVLDLAVALCGIIFLTKPFF